MSAVVAPPQSPYKGLTPFEDTDLDALLFFGRDREREVIAANVLASRLTVLYGPSGVGKSSLLRAGVAHRLREEGVPIVVLSTWSGDAVRELEDVLGRDGERVVVLDQFEEFFLYDHPEREFADLLADALRGSGTNFLLSLREDSLARLDAFKGRIPNLFANYLRLDRLDRSAGRDAIVGPVARWNALVRENDRVTLEPELVESVLDEVEAGKVDVGGAAEPVRDGTVEAPYLQLVLQRVWEEERRDGSRTLRLATLRRVGGAQEVVREHLERALAALSADEKDVAASVFRHLVTPSGTKIAHRLADLAAYADVEETKLTPVVSALGRERILRPVGGDGGGRYEIYHDVLGEAVLAWRSRRELERERERSERRRRRAVGVAAAAVAALAIVGAIAIFALVERSHSRAAARRAQGRAFAAQALVQLDLDAPKSLRLALRAARDAPSVETEDVLRFAFANDLLRNTFGTRRDPVTTVAYAGRGDMLLVGHRSGDVDVVEATTRRTHGTLGHGAPVATVAVSDARSGPVAMTAGGTRIRLWRLGRNEQIATYKAPAPIRTAAIAPDASAVVAGGSRIVWLWRRDRSRNRAAPYVLRQPRAVRRLLFSPDGRTLLVLVRERRARVYDARTGRLLHVISHRGFVFAGAFAPHSPLVATGSVDGEIRLTPVDGGRVIRIHDPWKSISDLQFSPDGSLLGVASGDGTARIYDVRTRSRLGVVVGHTRQATSIAFSPDSKYVVTGSADRTARLWATTAEDTGRLVASFTGSRGAVTQVLFSPNGRTVATVSSDGRARLWASALEHQLRPFASLRRARGVAASPTGRRVLAWGDGGAVIRAPRLSVPPVLDVATPVDSAAFAPDGQTVLLVHGGVATLRRVRDREVAASIDLGQPIAAAAVGRDGRLAAATGARVVVVGAHGARRDLLQDGHVTSLAFAPDGTLAAGTDSGTVDVWGSARRPLHVLRGHTGAIASVRFSSDGRLLVTASTDRTARIWSVGDGRLLGVLRGHTKALTSARFSPDARYVVTAGDDADARIWSVATHRSLHTLRGAFHTVSDASFSDDGRWVLGAGPRTALLWSARTGERLFYLRGPTQPVTAAAWAPHSHLIFVSSLDGTVRKYACYVCGTLPQLVRLARARLAATS